MCVLVVKTPTRCDHLTFVFKERETRDYAWLKSAAKEKNYKVEISPVSEYLASLAVIGPNSRNVRFLFVRAISAPVCFYRYITARYRCWPS